jgi:hypothetical protein
MREFTSINSQLAKLLQVKGNKRLGEMLNSLFLLSVGFLAAGIGD